MEKLTRILAVVENPESGLVVLDKAVAVARSFGAKVELLIIEAGYTRQFAAHCAEHGYDNVTLSSVHRGQHPMHEIILRRAFESAPDLVIKTPAGAHPMRRWTLDDNDWSLANECPVPVLLVRDRQWAKPVRFAAAVDVADDDSTDVSRSIVHTAGFLAMGLDASLDILYSEQERQDEALRVERAVKLAQLVREFHIGCERLEMLNGEPAKTLMPLVAARQYDVLVLGAQSRRPRRSAITGGTVGRLIQASNGDVVLVKAPHQEMHHVKPIRSAVEQRPHEIEQLV